LNHAVVADDDSNVGKSQGGRIMIDLDKAVVQAASHTTSAILNAFGLKGDENVLLGTAIERELKKFAQAILEQAATQSVQIGP
jgi:glycerol dehydrogenase-like iron-containing ADH family enzyme